MVLPALIVIAWVAAGAAAGVASGYVLDKMIGDGKYTKTELIVDATTGALGLSVLKAGAKVAGGVRYAAGAVKLEKAEDAVSGIKAGFAAARSGVAEIYAIKGVDLAISSLASRDWKKTGETAGMYVGVTGAAIQLARGKSPPKSSSRGGSNRSIPVKLGVGGIKHMTSASEDSSVNPISIDVLCKVCVLVLVGIEVTTGDLVNLL